MKKLIVAMLVSLIFMPAMAMGAEYAGVGLVCNTYGEAVAKVKDITVMDVLNEIINKDTIIEGTPLCVNYGIYNPFDITLDTSLVFTGDVNDIVFDVEPDMVTVDPAVNKLPEQAIPVKACFKVQTKYPYEPKKYVGSTTASWSLKSGGGTGSATGGSVECPFTLQANTERGQEIMLEQREQAMFKLQVLVVVIIAAIVLLAVLVTYKRKKRKEWETKIRNVCTKCRKQYPLSVEHCPKCGSRLKKFKANKEV